MRTFHQPNLNNLVALHFKKDEHFDDAVDLFGEILPGHEVFIPGNNTLIMDKEDRDIIGPLLKDKGLEYDDEEVVDGSDISQDRLSELRYENLFGKK